LVFVIYSSQYERTKSGKICPKTKQLRLNLAKVYQDCQENKKAGKEIDFFFQTQDEP